MESDFQRTAGRWYFDRQDLDVVQNTQTLLQHWIEQGKEINLVLHGWNKVPKRDGDFIRYQDSFGTLWQTQFEQASDGKLVKQRRENKKLVALGLLELREQHPQAGLLARGLPHDHLGVHLDPGGSPCGNYPDLAGDLGVGSRIGCSVRRGRCGGLGRMRQHLGPVRRLVVSP